jgi:hypothetical protein
VGEYCQKHEIATTHFFGKICGRFFLSASWAPPLGCAICSGRFPGELFKNAIELGEGLKSDLERDLADPKIAICQKFARLVEPGVRNVIDKIYAGHVLELFAQMGPTDVDRFRQLGQRNFFGGMLIDELPCLPDIHRFSSRAVARWLGESICGCCYHRTLSSHSWRRQAVPLLVMSGLILAWRSRRLLLA